MQAYVRKVATRHGLSVVEDGARNMIVKRRPSGTSMEAAKPVILQTHLDMVCEKNSDSSHDWERDTIVTTVRDGWLVADQTTLGSDNGIGVAMSLALMESPRDAVLPPLEFVFTVEEETGLFGAENLDVSLLEGRQLLNFDSEEFGIIYIGCAGGGDATVNLPIETEILAPPLLPFRLDLKGLQGGHSGADIHEGRANALLLLARVVSRLQKEISNFRLLHLEGGDKDNAIPRESFALVGLHPADLSQVQASLETIGADLKKEFGRIDPGLTLHIQNETVETPPKLPLSKESAQRLLDLIRSLPYGPLKMSHEVEGLVETSNNVAKVRRASDDLVQVLCFPRSSIDSALEDAQDRIAIAARRCGGTVSRTFTFPGWAPNASQALLSLAVDEFTKNLGKKPEVTAIHAGLECGIIGGKMPGVEMISFGPDIKGAHAPGERVHLTSVNESFRLAQQLLRRLAMVDDGPLRSEL